MTSLNPVMSIGDQLTEAIRTHQALGERAARARALEMLDAVHITDPARRLGQYPHELSGGMRQRVMIAMALSCQPKVLIADEPTTALDVTVQAQILKLMRELKASFGTSILLITHDMGVVAEMADRVAIMQGGRILEAGSAVDVFERPVTPYTRDLIAAVPRIGDRAGTDGPPRVTASPAAAAAPSMPKPVLEVSGLSVTYGGGGGWFGRKAAVPAVTDVGFTLAGRPHARPRRRERLRQVHHRQGRARADPLHRPRRHRRRAADEPRRRRHAPDPPTRADDLPGPLRLAGSAHDRRRRHRRTDADPRHRLGVRPGGPRRRASPARPPVARRRDALPPRILRRPAPTHLHRPRARSEAPAHRRRRERRRPRRLRPRPRPRPPARTSGERGHRLSLHQPRHGRRGAHVPRRRRHARRPHRRGRPPPPDLRGAPRDLHA